MSTYLPTTIRQAELDILNEPYFGGEWQLWLSHVAAIHLGDVDFSASGAAVYTDDPATGIASTHGIAASDLQAVVMNPLLSTAGSVVVTLVCNPLDRVGGSGGLPTTVDFVATFAPPAWVADQSFYFPRGYAVDFVPAIDVIAQTIVSMSSATHGNKNARIAVWQLPNIALDYFLVGCTDGIDFNLRGRMAKGIDCGMETDAFVKAGKSMPGKLTLSSKYKSLADGLARFSGMKGTAMLVGIKDGQVTGDRIVFTQFRPGAEISLPEGDNDSVVKSEGKFVEALFFTAGYTP